MMVTHDTHLLKFPKCSMLQDGLDRPALLATLSSDAAGIHPFIGLTMANTIVAVSHTSLRVAEAAGRELADSVLQKLNASCPDVLIVFASPEFDFPLLLATLGAACQPRLIVGCSSAGEFSGCATGNASVSVMAIRADDILFRARLGTGLRSDFRGALDQVMPVFSGGDHPDFPYRNALVLTDALAG
jgi:hypothetical protein